MTTFIANRQLITDLTGNPIGVILSLDEFALVKEVLDQYHPVTATIDPLAQLAQASHDPLFMADLQETMNDFEQTDLDGLTIEV